MSKVGIIGTYGRVSGSSYMDTSTLLNKVGANTGNLLFQYAITKSIAEEYLVVGEDLPWDPKLVAKNCRILVIPSANFIRENFDFTGFVNFLESTGLPLVFVGLGAQAVSYSQTDFDFHPSILKLISLLKERTELVSLRGDFTKNLLRSYGVENTLVTGCPTNFINRDKDFVEKLDRKWKKSAFSFMATGDEPWPKNLKKRDVERKMIEWVDSNPALFIQQSVEPFIRYARQSNPYQSELVPEHHERSLRNSIAPWMSDEQFRAFIAVKLRIYYNVDQWMEDAARVDFSLGMRLHGNMAAWQSATPAVWIYHDSRTRELSETMALPNISFENFIDTKNVEELKETVGFDSLRYSEARVNLRNNLIKIFSSSGIQHNYEVE